MFTPHHFFLAPGVPLILLGVMTINATFIRPRDLRAGEARALRVSGLSPEDTLVFLNAADQVSRVQRGTEETQVVSWPLEQVLRDVLDPHATE